MKSYKKFLAIILSLTLLFSTLSCLALITSAEAVVEDIQVDLTKSTSVKPNNLGIRFDGVMDGAVRADIHIGWYPAIENVWKEAIMTVNDSNGQPIRFEEGYKYAINVKYYVLTTTKAPTVAIVHNSGISATQDNGSITLAMSEQHSAKGVYTLSAVTEVTDVMNNTPLRLAFGGNASVVVTDVKVQRVAADADVSVVNYVVNGVKTTELVTGALKVPEYENSIHYYKNELIENESVIDSIFGGWYADEALTTSNSTVEDGATYYAKWASVTRKIDLLASNRMVTWNNATSSNAYYTNDMLTITPNTDTGAIVVQSNNTNNDWFTNGQTITSRGDAHLTLEYYDYEDTTTYDNDYTGYAKMDANKQYAVNVNYAVTAVSGEAGLGIVVSSKSITGGSNCTSRVMGGKNQITAVGNYATYTSLNGGGPIDNTYGGSDVSGYNFRLHFKGNATFVINYVTIQETYKDDNTAGKVTGVTYREALAGSYLDHRYVAVKDYSGAWQIPEPLKLGDVEGVEFGGWCTDEALSTAFGSSVSAKQNVYAKWNYIKSNVDLSASNTVASSPTDITLTKPTETTPLTVGIQAYNENLFGYESYTAKSSAWLSNYSITLENFDNDTIERDNTFAGYAYAYPTYKFVVTVKYNVTQASYDSKYYPQIAVVTARSDSGALGENAASTIRAGKKHATAGNNFVLSAVFNADAANRKIRLAFSGAGKFEITSVTITQVHTTATDYAKVIYSYDAGTEADFVKLGSELITVPNNAEQNFAGWYSGNNKVETITADTNLTALYVSKYDVDFNYSFDICDLVLLRNAIIALSDNSAYDINRDGILDDADTDAVRKNLLSVQKNTVTIAGSEISTFSVVKANEGSLLTDLAADTIADKVNTSFGTNVEVTDVAADNKIVVGIANVDNNSAINSVVGVKGDTYGVNDYKVFSYNGDLYIEGGSDFALAAGATAFSKYLSAHKTFAKGMVITGSADNTSEILDGYKRVYSEEFNGETINTSGKWWFKSGTADGPYYNVSDHYYSSSIVSGLTGNKFGGPWTRYEGSNYREGIITYGNVQGENYNLVDGAIVLNTKKTENGYNATELHAAHSYKYGIMTARVKFDTDGGAASTVWARTDDNASKLVNEFDFVENYGINQVIPNLHIWDNRDGAASDHIDLDNSINVQNTITNVEDTYHDIAMIWTAEKIQFYFDGVLYLEQDITDTETYAAFHVSTRMVFGISAGSGYYADSANKNGKKPGDVLGELIGTFNENLHIDYVRWYQK